MDIFLMCLNDKKSVSQCAITVRASACFSVCASWRLSAAWWPKKSVYRLVSFHFDSFHWEPQNTNTHTRDKFRIVQQITCNIRLVLLLTRWWWFAKFRRTNSNTHSKTDNSIQTHTHGHTTHVLNGVMVAAAHCLFVFFCVGHCLVATRFFCACYVLPL